MRLASHDMVEALLEELETESLDWHALESHPKPSRPLQNATPLPRPSISVVIPAGEFSPQLFLVLQHLAYARDELDRRTGKRVEIIVAPYGACRGSAAAVEEFDARLLPDNGPGRRQSRADALNAAATEARANLLAFVKPELMPERHCLCHIAQAFADKRTLGGGTNVLSSTKTVASKLLSVLDSLPLRLSGLRLGIVFVRKSAFRRIGGVRRTRGGGELLDLLLRLKKHALLSKRRITNVKLICATQNGKASRDVTVRQWISLLLAALILPS
ncbi:MAG: hypothetical protein V2A71_04975 [Candidatus Eisenbacteria bacterium]